MNFLVGSLMLYAAETGNNVETMHPPPTRDLPKSLDRLSTLHPDIQCTSLTSSVITTDICACVDAYDRVYIDLRYAPR